MNKWCLAVLGTVVAGSLGSAEPWRETIVTDGAVLSVMTTRMDGGEAPRISSELWLAGIGDNANSTEHLSELIESRYGKGPAAWGVVGEDFYFIRHGKDPAIPQATRGMLDDYVAVLRGLRDGGSIAGAWERCMERGRDRSLFLMPLGYYYEHPAEDLRNGTGSFYDIAFLDDGHGTLYVHSGGWLRWYSFDDAAEGSNRKFTREGGVESSMTGTFRAMRSRDRIVLIDERGGVYASPEDGHGRLGALGNWPKQPSTDRAIYLLEDARNHLLCALEVVDDPDDPEKKIIIELPFIGEGDAENPFAIMSDERVKEALIRLTEAIENGNKGGGNGG